MQLSYRFGSVSHSDFTILEINNLAAFGEVQFPPL